MIGTIIGGAIAAVTGALGYAIGALLLERCRERARRLRIVDALIVEIVENLIIWKRPEEGLLWWTSSFRLEAYEAYKSEIFFLNDDIRFTLADAVFRMRDSNTTGQMIQRATTFGHDLTVDPMPAKLTVEQLESVLKGLKEWKVEHSRSLSLRIRRRLRRFISKIRKNSGLRHT